MFPKLNRVGVSSLVFGVSPLASPPPKPEKKKQDTTVSTPFTFRDTELTLKKKCSLYFATTCI